MQPREKYTHRGQMIACMGDLTCDGLVELCDLRVLDSIRDRLINSWAESTSSASSPELRCVFVVGVPFRVPTNSRPLLHLRLLCRVANRVHHGVPRLHIGTRSNPGNRMSATNGGQVYHPPRKDGMAVGPTT